MKRSQFTEAVFSHCKFPITHERLTIGVAWAAIEGSDAHNNPWDTTLDFAGATDYNTVGVKNYASWEDGIEATTATLQEDYYAQLRQAFEYDGSTVIELLNALNNSPWGSHITKNFYDEVAADFARFDTEVAGSPDYKPPVVLTPEQEELAIVVKNESKFKELPVLKEGDTGRAVLLASVWLAYLGHTGVWPTETATDHTVEGAGVVTPTSTFDAQLKTAVTDYQHVNLLHIDGIIGPEVWDSFFYSK